jgi:hypothetical protein
MNKEDSKMSKVVKYAAKILTKAVGKGLGTGLKVGAAAALAFGAAGCESTPVERDFMIHNGNIISQEDFINKYDKVEVRYGVDLDGNKETAEQYLEVTKKFQQENPGLQIGANVTFKESDYSRVVHYVGEGYIIAINQRQAQH